MIRAQKHIRVHIAMLCSSCDSEDYGLGRGRHELTLLFLFSGGIVGHFCFWFLLSEILKTHFWTSLVEEWVLHRKTGMELRLSSEQNRRIPILIPSYGAWGFLERIHYRKRGRFFPLKPCLFAKCMRFSSFEL